NGERRAGVKGVAQLEQPAADVGGVHEAVERTDEATALVDRLRAPDAADLFPYLEVLLIEVSLAEIRKPHRPPLVLPEPLLSVHSLSCRSQKCGGLDCFTPTRARAIRRCCSCTDSGATPTTGRGSCPI